MVVIFEGINKMGKSTIIKTLAQRDPRIVVVKDNTINEVEEADKRAFVKGGIYSAITLLNAISAFDDKDKIFVFDRFHLTEYVYSMVKRGYTPHYIFDDIDPLLANRGAKLVLMTDTLANVLGRNDPVAYDELVNLQSAMNVAYIGSGIHKMMARLPEIEKVYSFITW